MERIKQAIDKAKRQQAEEVTVRSEQPAPPFQPARISDSESLNYSKTRVVTLDPAHLEKHRIVAFNKNDPLSVGFDLLRTQVLRKMDENGWRTLAVTSPIPECGKSVVAINLAMSIAHHTSKTAMLVDFDLRRPSVAKYLGLSSSEASLNEVLAGKADVSEALVNPGLQRFVLLPTARPEKKPAEVLSSNKVQSLVGNLRNRYADRIVLFDLPPLLSTDDALSILPQMDCVLMVVGDGMVTKPQIQESLRHLPSVNVIGVVLNKAQIAPTKYYY